MKVFYSDRFDLHPPAGHRFPGTKYGLLRRRLIEAAIIDAAMLQPSPPASGDEIAIAHDPDYIAAIETGTIAPAAMRRIGFPWSRHIWERARATMGGTVAAATRRRSTPASRPTPTPGAPRARFSARRGLGSN